MNLTEEQEKLLEKIVEVYDSGCRGPFIFVSTQDGSKGLVYPGRANERVEADVIDFQQLAQEGLITISQISSSEATGKVTGKGIQTARSWLSPPVRLIPPLSAAEPNDYVIRSDGHGGFGVSALTERAQRRADGPQVPSGTTLAFRTRLDAVLFVQAGEADGFTFAGAQLLMPETTRKVLPPRTEVRTTIFIGHGHSKEWLVLKDFLRDRLHLEHVEFNSDSAAGLQTQERLVEMLRQATFAFLVMTAEEEHADGRRHARENVIHEAGLFQGKLGFRKAILLVEEGCEKPSNVHGLTLIDFPRARIDAAFEEVRRVLEREGVIPAESAR